MANIIRKLWGVYVKKEASYGDGTISTIDGNNFVPVYGESVDVQIKSDVVEVPPDPRGFNKKGDFVMSKRWVEFSFEVPMDKGGRYSPLLLGAGFNEPFAGIYEYQGKFDSLAMVFDSDNKYRVRAKGAYIEELQFIFKVGEIARLKVKGKGLFVDESYNPPSLSPSSYPVASEFIKSFGGSVEISGAGDLENSNYWDELSVSIKNDLVELLDYTDSNLLKELKVIGGEVSGQFNPLGNIYLKDVGEEFVGVLSFNDGDINFYVHNAKIKDRSVKFDNEIMRKEVAFQCIKGSEPEVIFRWG